MKKYFLQVLASFLLNLVLVFLPNASSSQISDNFSDGDFTSNPSWTGNDTSFVIDSFMLRSNGPQASSVIYLSTSNTLIDSAEWNFLVRLDFNPSSTNLVKIYLVSDQADLSDSLNGYFLQLGESGTAPDTIDIFKQTGTTVTKVFTGVTGIITSSSSNSIRIRVLRHTGGTWDVFADKTGGTNLMPEGSFSDNTISSTAWFGVVCKYSTASRYNLYYFDDFSISNIMTDTTKPLVTSVTVLSSTGLDVKFSEPLEPNSAASLTNYWVNNSIGSPSSAILDGSDLSLMHLLFSNEFAAGTQFSLSISGVKDAAGNVMNADLKPFYLIGPRDIVINEILFNPKTGGSDFIELYNRTDHPIDLKQFDILERDVSDPATILEQAPITSESWLLLPKHYVVVSENIENIQQNYFVENPDALIKVPSLPNFPDDGGICVLQAHHSIAIDSLSFSSKWHFALLDIEDGVSLERIDYNKPTQDKNNWHSAASTVGFATPTYRNSQFAETGVSEDEVKIDPEVFTPDNDGEKDITNINYKFAEPGYIMNAKVYDAKGREIRNLVESELLGSEGAFQWDGIDDENTKARVGIYIFYIEVFNLQGQVKKFKKQVVLGARLN
jgi:hypothetical protein